MSTIKSSSEDLTLNADGASKDIKFQANGVEKASISSAGAFTSTTIDATKLTGNLPAISGASLTGITTGKVLQVVHNSTTTNYTVSASDADVTNHTLAITPTSATSTIMLFIRTHYYYSGSDSGWSITLRRTVGATNTNVHSDSTAYAYYGETGATNRRGEISLNYKDSPSTTSAITYKIRARKNSGTITLNENSIGSITAFEIGA